MSISAGLIFGILRYPYASFKGPSINKSGYMGRLGDVRVCNTFVKFVGLRNSYHIFLYGCDIVSDNLLKNIRDQGSLTNCSSL